MPEFICTALDYVFSLTHLIAFVLLDRHGMNIIFFDTFISVRIECVLALELSFKSAFSCGKLLNLTDALCLQSLW